MQFKSFALGGAAAVLVTTALSMPVLAFTHHPATAEEQRQTDDLNAQQLSKTTQPDVVMTQASPVAAPVERTAANTALESPQTATVAANGAVSLDAVANSPQTLANASVETMNGQAIGAVQKVVTGNDGKAQTVDIALLGAQTKIVAIDASQLTYDQSRNVLVAQLSADQIQALPPAPQG